MICILTIYALLFGGLARNYLRRSLNRLDEMGRDVACLRGHTNLDAEKRDLLAYGVEASHVSSVLDLTHVLIVCHIREGQRAEAVFSNCDDIIKCRHDQLHLWHRWRRMFFFHLMLMGLFLDCTHYLLWNFLDNSHAQWRGYDFFQWMFLWMLSWTILIFIDWVALFAINARFRVDTTRVTAFLYSLVIMSRQNRIEDTSHIDAGVLALDQYIGEDTPIAPEVLFDHMFVVEFLVLLLLAGCYFAPYYNLVSRIYLY